MKTHINVTSIEANSLTFNYCFYLFSCVYATCTRYPSTKRQVEDIHNERVYVLFPWIGNNSTLRAMTKTIGANDSLDSIERVVIYTSHMMGLVRRPQTLVWHDKFTLRCRQSTTLRWISPFGAQCYRRRHVDCSSVFWTQMKFCRFSSHIIVSHYLPRNDVADEVENTDTITIGKCCLHGRAMSTLSEGRWRRWGCGKSITVLVNVGFSISTIPFMETWLRKLRPGLWVAVWPSRNVFCHLQYIMKLSWVQIHSFPSDDDFEYPETTTLSPSFGRFTHNGKSMMCLIGHFSPFYCVTRSPIGAPSK